MGQTHYHPKCFTCTDCKEPLGTSKYYIINGKNYCGKCRAKFLENCTKCGKMIENETIRPKETGKPYCPECFCCTKCDIPLQGKYFNTEDGILCEECFAVRIQKLSMLASLALIALNKYDHFPSFSNTVQVTFDCGSCVIIIRIRNPHTLWNILV